MNLSRRHSLFGVVSVEWAGGRLDVSNDDDDDGEEETDEGGREDRKGTRKNGVRKTEDDRWKAWREETSGVQGAAEPP